MPISSLPSEITEQIWASASKSVTISDIPSVIKSIQTGQMAQATTSSTIWDVPLGNSVDLSKSYCFHTESSSNARDDVTCELLNSTTLRIQRVSNNTNINLVMNWTVIEFE